MINLHLFAPPFVYSEEVTNHSKIKESLFPEIAKLAKDKGVNSSKWNCDCFTSWETDLNSFLEKEEVLREIVWSPLENLTKSFLGQFVPSLVSAKLIEIWFNFYEKGYFQEIHTHDLEKPSNVISGIYILHLEQPGQNTTLFHRIDRCNLLVSDLRTDNFDEGTVLLFPSSLHHEVLPCLGERATISFNLDLLLKDPQGKTI
jgi:hypothetical protein